ncbi:beta-lactamase/transpeptidase-like protein [Gloeopeniophorella convolvens]|nr:beta-lactamase/transpeptidase-like protein [Gloeopeniophorella convolvens]
MRLRLVTVIALLRAGSTIATGSQQPFDAYESSSATQPILTPEFGKAVQEIMDAHLIPGLTLAVVRKDGLSEFGAWGKKSEDGAAVTTDTLFNIGSCSKAFLAAAIGLLIDDYAHGRNATPLPSGLPTLTWKTKVADILPDDWELSDPWATEKANLIDILSHQSGLPSHDLAYKPGNSTLSATRNLRNLRPSYELRESYLYNNQMYMVGAQIVTALSGVSFVEFVEGRIFKPLNMTSSTYSVNAAIKSGKASQTWDPTGRLIPHWIKENYTDLMAGPGGVISNVEELSAWVKVHLNGGVDPRTNTTVVPPSALEAATSAHSIADSTPQSSVYSIRGYGMGWARFSYAGHDFIQHTGGAPGVSATIAAALGDGIAVIALVNADLKQPVMIDLSFVIARKLFGMPDALEALPEPNVPHNPESLPAWPAPHRVDMACEMDAAPAADLTGTYDDLGYGSLTLCSAQSESSACQSVLRDLRSIEGTSGVHNLTAGYLFAAWESVFTHHVVLVPLAERRFLLMAGTVYPAGYGRNTTPFAHWLGPPDSVEFVLRDDGSVKGFGIGAVGERGGYGSVEDDAEVWFVKRDKN